MDRWKKNNKLSHSEITNNAEDTEFSVEFTQKNKNYKNELNKKNKNG
nr:hypothetical protein [Oceanobacillus salinisoli]